KERWDEGPFGEFSGYRASPRMPRPVYRVECITHRNNPILTVTCMGVPINESHLVHNTFGDSLMAMQAIKDAGIPIKGVYLPPESVSFLLVVVVDKKYSGIVQEIVSAVHASKGGFRSLYIVVCDDDVDPVDLPSVFHAFFTKCHPARGMQLNNFSVGWALVPFLDLHDRKFAKGCSVSFDCTWPVEWDPFKEVPQKVSFENLYPQEIKERVLRNWYSVYSLPEEGGRWRL
ncbi:MAG: UbiD family decarboxylase domain-containing protein, partial [Dehalococcoidia bacterium]